MDINTSENVAFEIFRNVTTVTHLVQIAQNLADRFEMLSKTLLLYWCSVSKSNSLYKPY